MHHLRLYAHANAFIFVYSPLTPSNEPTIKDPAPWSSKLKNKHHHCIHSLHHPEDYNLVASTLMSAGAPTRKGAYQLNCPEIPSHRRSADELPILLSTNRQMNPAQDNCHQKYLHHMEQHPRNGKHTRLKFCRFFVQFRHPMQYRSQQYIQNKPHYILLSISYYAQTYKGGSSNNYCFSSLDYLKYTKINIATIMTLFTPHLLCIHQTLKYKEFHFTPKQIRVPNHI